MPRAGKKPEAPAKKVSAPVDRVASRSTRSNNNPPEVDQPDPMAQDNHRREASEDSRHNDTSDGDSDEVVARDLLTPHRDANRRSLVQAAATAERSAETDPPTSSHASTPRKRQRNVLEPPTPPRPASSSRPRPSSSQKASDRSTNEEAEKENEDRRAIEQAARAPDDYFDEIFAMASPSKKRPPVRRTYVAKASRKEKERPQEAETGTSSEDTSNKSPRRARAGSRGQGAADEEGDGEDAAIKVASNKTRKKRRVPTETPAIPITYEGSPPPRRRKKAALKRQPREPLAAHAASEKEEEEDADVEELAHPSANVGDEDEQRSQIGTDYERPMGKPGIEATSRKRRNVKSKVSKSPRKGKGKGKEKEVVAESEQSDSGRSTRSQRRRGEEDQEHVSSKSKKRRASRAASLADDPSYRSDHSDGNATPPPKRGRQTGSSRAAKRKKRTPPSHSDDDGEAQDFNHWNEPSDDPDRPNNPERLESFTHWHRKQGRFVPDRIWLHSDAPSWKNDDSDFGEVGTLIAREDVVRMIEDNGGRVFGPDLEDMRCAGEEEQTCDIVVVPDWYSRPYEKIWREADKSGTTRFISLFVAILTDARVPRVRRQRSGWSTDRGSSRRSSFKRMDSPQATDAIRRVGPTVLLASSSKPPRRTRTPLARRHWPSKQQRSFRRLRKRSESTG